MNELHDFLRVIDEHLEEDGLEGRIPLYIFGGAAVVVAYGASRATQDIDAYVEDRRIEGKLVAWAGRDTELAAKHGLYFQPANLSLMPIEDPDWRERCVAILPGRFRHLDIKALGKEDLILSKLGRYSDRDRADIQFLAENHSVDVDKLVKLYGLARDYYVGRISSLDATFNLVLEENFGRPPVKFKTG